MVHWAERDHAWVFELAKAEFGVGLGTVGGYHLGDWTDTWETYARRTTAGDWEATGRETLARQRTGVTPETPTKEGSARMAE